MRDRNAELSSERERKGHGAGGRAEERATEGARGVAARSCTWDLRRYRNWEAALHLRKELAWTFYG